MKMTSMFRNVLKSRAITRLMKQFSTSRRNFKDEPLNDGPIKFSQSAAIRYKAETSRTGMSEPRLWYEPYVLMGSLAVFLVYFCALREENDLDVELNASLYSRIQGLEEFQLRQSLKYNQGNGLDTKAIVQRLREIEESRHSESD